jgi:S-adenosylmethionine decarboxylase
MYKEGLHIISSITTTTPNVLNSFTALQNKLNSIIQELQLQKLGEVYHQFETGGYTMVVCLSESHISMHTWPEYSLVNLDIYLSNFMHNNENKVEHLYSLMQEYFGGEVIKENKIYR